MSIIIQTSGSLKQRIEPGTVVEHAETVGDVLASFTMPEDVAVVMMVNGRIAYWHTPLQPGDVLQLVPVIGGGACSDPA